MSRDIQWIKGEIANSSLNAPGAGPEALQRELQTFPIDLPLSSEEQFDEAEAVLREETVRRKMVSSCLFCHRNILHIANLQVQKALKEKLTPKMTFPPLLINHALNLCSIVHKFKVVEKWFK